MLSALPAGLRAELRPARLSRKRLSLPAAGLLTTLPLHAPRLSRSRLRGTSLRPDSLWVARLSWLRLRLTRLPSSWLARSSLARLRRPLPAVLRTRRRSCVLRTRLLYGGLLYAGLLWTRLLWTRTRLLHGWLTGTWLLRAGLLRRTVLCTGRWLYALRWCTCLPTRLLTTRLLGRLRRLTGPVLRRSRVLRSGRWRGRRRRSRRLPEQRIRSLTLHRPRTLPRARILRRTTHDLRSTVMRLRRIS
jgi:hypothetical protein